MVKQIVIHFINTHYDMLLLTTYNLNYGSSIKQVLLLIESHII